MPLNRYRFYLGPVGNLVALPPFVKGGNPAATATLLGAQHVGLSGRTTIDINGYKRRWPFSCTYRNEAEYQALIAGFRRINVGPFGALRLVDLRRSNCLGMQLSSGGSERQSTRDFTASGGTLAFGAQSGLPTAINLLYGAQVWTPTANAQTLLSGPTTVPVVAGASYLFSAWASVSGATFTPLIQPYDITGAALAVVNGTTTAVSATWTRYSVGRYTPAAGVASFAVGWSTGGAGTCNTTGWQVETDPTSSTPAAFMLGQGIPTVYVESFSEVYPYLNRMSSDFVLQEV